MIAAMRSERSPLSSLSLRALRIYSILALIFLHGCAHFSVHPNARLTPPDTDPFVFENDIDQWREVCVQRAWGDEDALAKWDCLTMAELRAIVRQRVRADN